MNDDQHERARRELETLGRRAAEQSKEWTSLLAELHALAGDAQELRSDDERLVLFEEATEIQHTMPRAMWLSSMSAMSAVAPMSLVRG